MLFVGILKPLAGLTHSLGQSFLGTHSPEDAGEGFGILGIEPATQERASAIFMPSVDPLARRQSVAALQQMTDVMEQGRDDERR